MFLERGAAAGPSNVRRHAHVLSCMQFKGASCVLQALGSSCSVEVRPDLFEAGSARGIPVNGGKFGK